MRRRLPLLLAVLALVVGCTTGSDGTTAPTTQPVVPAPTSTAAEATTTTSPLPLAGAQLPTATCPAVPAQAAPDPDRPRYTMSVRVNLDDNVVEGRLTVRFRPDLSTDRLVFRLWPNGPRSAAAGAHLEAGPVFLGAAVPVPTEAPDPTTLVVPLQAPLAAGDEIEATVPWTLTLPGASNDRLARQGEAVRLGSFFPILAWEPGVGWATDPPTSAFAEASTTPVADFSYSVSVPDGLTVLASGVQDGERWRAVAVRDVGVSIGRFRTAEAVTSTPRPVAVTVGVHEGVAGDPRAYLERVVRALEAFSRRFGPLPYPTYSVALTPALSGGIEYPGHVMQGPDTMGRTLSHEVAHMWFYALVGNNQAVDPWLDEGLATWAEAHFEGTLDGVVARSIPAAGRNRVGEPMTYWEDHQDAYYRSVYVQGAQALSALGDPEAVDCALRIYAATSAFAIARPGNLLEALRRVFPDADATLAGFGAL
ncbi:MAG TPA: M1 family aminopeptidase [Acidimicrobiales bacterium]|nr:M1 family aminopeptidase [Acidimicrobiales bacterium]